MIRSDRGPPQVAAASRGRLAVRGRPVHVPARFEACVRIGGGRAEDGIRAGVSAALSLRLEQAEAPGLRWTRSLTQESPSSFYKGGDVIGEPGEVARAGMRYLCISISRVSKSPLNITIQPSVDIRVAVCKGKPSGIPMTTRRRVPPGLIVEPMKILERKEVRVVNAVLMLLD